MTGQGPILKGGALALGNFDGVHRGHAALVATTIAAARTKGIPARVMTFEPHPRAVLNPDAPPFRLTSSATRESLLRRLGVDEVITLPFTPEFSQLSAQDFAARVLRETYGAQQVLAGTDFVYGSKRSGNMQVLSDDLAPYGVEVTPVPLAMGDGGESLSSSHVRKALQEGDIATATRVLGRRWSIAGKVKAGAGRGRVIGVPTANLTLGDYLRPRYGVYAVKASRTGEALAYRGVANIGVRPTVDGKTELLEVHLFDFSEDIYGQEWEISLEAFLRAEQAFPSLDALKTQIIKDMAVARATLGVT
ncbi:MAG: bifunctional riboflavin kinase/FAD synthetase [Bdellovibrionales bacterium]